MTSACNQFRNVNNRLRTGMLPTVNLVLVVLMVCGARSELQICRRSFDAQRDETIYNQNVSLSAQPEANSTNEDKTVGELEKLLILNDQDRFEGRGKKKMDRMLMSLIIAYKLKFMALIPTLIGTTILLFASNALVGFFFALFAAVVSMKSR